MCGEKPDLDKLFFKAYDAATEASRRSRQVIYFALLVEFFCLFAIRETRFPRWVNARLGLMQDYSICTINPAALKDCLSAKKVYENSRLPLPNDNLNDQKYYKYFDDSDCKNDPTGCKKYNVPHPLSEYEKFASREQALITQSVSDLAVPIPILGLRVDTNDLWVFVGPITATVLLVLVFTLRADISCTALAERYAEKDPDLLELVRTIAVLGRRLSDGYKFDVVGFHVIRWLVIVIPVLNAFALFFLDFLDKEGAFNTNIALEQESAAGWRWPFSPYLADCWPYIDLAGEFLFLILVIVVASAVYKTSQIMIDAGKR